MGIALVAAALAGCSDEAQRTRAAPAADSGALPDWSWSAPRSGGGPVLIARRGPAEPVELTFSCPRPGNVSIAYEPVTTSPPATLVLLNGDLRSSLPATVRSQGDGQPRTVAVEASLADPVIAAFRRSGRLAIYRPGELTGARATGSELDLLEAFFDDCQAGPAPSGA